MPRHARPRPRLLTDDARRALLGCLTAAVAVLFAAVAPTAIGYLLAGHPPG
jgi:hypothetical protein